MLIYMDFLCDHDRMVYDHLAKRGFKKLDEVDRWRRYALFYDNDGRKVPLRRYTVHLSEELAPKMETLASRLALQEVIGRLQRGKAMDPYLSRQTEHIEKLDHLLLHWGINHLHLSSISTIQSHGFVQRSDEILFFRVDGDHVYLIDVLPHPRKGSADWANTELVRTVDRNWPHLHMLLMRNGTLDREVTDVGYKLLQRAGINTPLQTPRGIVMPTMGVSAAGHSSESMEVYNRTNKRLSALQTLLRLRYKSMFPDARGYVTCLSLLAIEEDGFIVKDGCTGRHLHIPTQFLMNAA